ncbi:hypothetical protein [Kordia zhangzhouensis]|uniref:hypothetical protein n=1 Tax=Kordia zhangzhouensis TaxID=1620405 RepID=UPI0012F97519|nr:hypothetical protein [Kordia zhangzhouensis]
MKKYILHILVLLAGSTLYSQETSCLSFSLNKSKKYIVSAWVKEDNSNEKKTYTNGTLEIHFYTGDSATPSYPVMTMYPSGKIIDGWQRIIGIIQITESQNSNNTPDSLRVRLSCQNESDCYFDDVRIFPFNSSMKSFVYDKDTQRLMAELDENNYATYYEYDKEGGLVRVKKETEKGVYTIQETRSKSKKQ